MRNLPVCVAAGFVLVAAACIGTSVDHEVLGDRAYTNRYFAEALAEYRWALRQRANPTLRVKAGAAALRAGNLVAAVEEYRALAEAGGEPRATEAADGLERVARAAAENDDRAALSAALLGLREISAARALGRFAEELARTLGAEARSVEGLNVLPYAAAGAPDARHGDSLMYVYGAGLARLGRCDQAVVVLEGLLRRRREPAVLRVADRDFATCALQMGQRSLDSGLPQGAEEWFRKAATRTEQDELARAAYIGLGDVMFARGDFPGAAEAYQRAMTGAEAGDSLAQIAAERLNVVANAGAVIR